MARKRLPMSQIKEILRLLWEQKQTVRATSRALGVSVGVVSKVSNRAKLAKLTWDDLASESEAEIAARLYGRSAPAGAERPEPDPVEMHKELMKTGVTLELLHLEYLEQHPAGLKYTAFCDRYRAWRKRRGLTMRQPHRAGDNVFIDFSGKRPSYTDRTSGEKIEVELFVAVLGASNLTFAEATPSQKVGEFVRVNIHALEYFGGVPQAVVPDRLKSAIVDSDPFEPTVQKSFADFARHYGTAVVPARPYKARDKAKVEGAVLIAQRWILAKMRRETFFSLAELNTRIRELLDELNDRPMKKLGGVSRRELFEKIERGALTPLPADRFEPSTWRKVRAGTDYHVTLEEHGYSVPHALARELLEARITAATVEIFYRGKRVASHPRSRDKFQATTNPAHMPEGHRAWAERDPEQLIEWAASVGPNAATLMRRILKRSPIAIQGWRSGRGLRHLGETYDAERIEEASRRALRFGAETYKPVERMLKLELDLHPLPDETPEQSPIEHEQVRGPDYYLN